MNHAQLAALQPFYFDMLRTKTAQPHRSLLDMLELRLRADLVLANGTHSYLVTVRDLNNPVRRFDQLGLVTDDLVFELVPARVWAWAEQQLTPDPGNVVDTLTGLEVYLRASIRVTGQPGQLAPESAPTDWLRRWGPPEEFAVLLRGIRAWQTKRRKRARRQLAQLRAYDTQLSQQLALKARVEPAVAAPVGVPSKMAKVKIHQVAVAAEAVLGEGGAVL